MWAIDSVATDMTFEYKTKASCLEKGFPADAARVVKSSRTVYCAAEPKVLILTPVLHKSQIEAGRRINIP